MLTHLKSLLPVTPTSSQKFTTVDKQHSFLDSDFFKPLATESGISCTYTPEFYEAFSQSSGSSQLSELAMLVLEYMTLQDKARLPLFKGASDRYVKQVLPSIKQKLASKETDDETLATKFHIMNCASQVGYLTRSSVVFLSAVVLDHVSLTGMNLSCAFLPGASLREANLSDVNLSGANLMGANLSGACLRKTNLRGAELLLTNLRGAKLIGANLSMAEFGGADLSRADLSAADLTNANLSKADLIEANLTGADLTGTILRGADLTGTDLRRVDLRRADLSKTNLPRIDLSKAGTGWTNFCETQ